MKLLMFVHYYIKLRFEIILRLHHTTKPLSVWWRWKYWNQRQRFHEHLLKRLG